MNIGKSVFMHRNTLYLHTTSVYPMESLDKLARSCWDTFFGIGSGLYSLNPEAAFEILAYMGCVLKERRLVCVYLVYLCK